jgi:hypothetical protein
VLHALTFVPHKIKHKVLQDQHESLEYLSAGWSLTQEKVIVWRGSPDRHAHQEQKAGRISFVSPQRSMLSLQCRDSIGAHHMLQSPSNLYRWSGAQACRCMCLLPVRGCATPRTRVRCLKASFNLKPSDLAPDAAKRRSAYRTGICRHSGKSTARFMLHCQAAGTRPVGGSRGTHERRAHTTPPGEPPPLAAPDPIVLKTILRRRQSPYAGPRGTILQVIADNAQSGYVKRRSKAAAQRVSGGR